MRRFLLPGLAALTLVGCPREVMRMDAGPPAMDAGPLLIDAGETPRNDFTGPITFNDDALRELDPSVLPTGPSPCREPVLVRVEFVVDGDTFGAAGVSGAFSGNVRIIGVDTPEVARDMMPAECYGPQAEGFTSMLTGHLVWLTFDSECTDRFSRTLAYVHIGIDEGGFWERQLLRRGFATELGVGGNRTFESMFEADESQAARDRAGLWDACR